MGSVEMDELLYDGGNRLATQDMIDLEDELEALDRRERVQALAEAGDPHTIELLDQAMAEDWKAILVLLARGEREKAHEMLDAALERAMEWVAA
jgi:hypothetical protein